MKALLFLAGLLLTFIYYALVWCYARRKTKLEKLKLRFGESSKPVKKFSERYPLLRCSLPVRMLVFTLGALLVVYLAEGRELIYFVAGAAAANLTLFFLLKGMPRAG